MGSLVDAPPNPSSFPPRDSRTPKFDTTYRIVDRSHRSSRPPPAEPARDQWQYSPRATQPLATPAGMVKPITQVSERRSAPPPAAAAPEGERAASTAPPEPSFFQEASRAETAIVRVGGPIPGGDEIIAPRAPPPSWRPPIEVSSTNNAHELKQLRDQLLQLGVRKCFVVGVTGRREVSAAKSVAAAKLASLLAERARVLLMEANFDWPAVHRILSLHTPPAAGFSQQMHARIRSGERQPWIVVRCSDGLHVLAEGIIRSPGILFSQEFAVAIGELRQCYDFIVVDCPVAQSESEYKPINSLTDGIVVTVAPGGKLSDGLDDVSKWFTRKELTAAVFGEATA